MISLFLVFSEDSAPQSRMLGIHSLYSRTQSNRYSELFNLFLFRNKVNRTHPKIIFVCLFLNRSVFGGFVDNHDNPRFLNLNPSHTGLKNVLTFVIMEDWIPIVYYGTEQGFDGGSDPNNRESLWPYMSAANPLYRFIQTLAKFRLSLGNEWLQEKQVTGIKKITLYNLTLN